MKIDHTIAPRDLLPAIRQLWEISGGKIDSIDHTKDRSKGSPVHTVAGRYQPRGWTEWTQGFEFGSAILQFDATGEQRFLDLGMERIRTEMPAHVTNFGSHDHGFNQISTYGNLRRLSGEGRIDLHPGQQDYVDLALCCSGAVQAHRWADLGDGQGYIYSAFGRHSLLVDSLRSLRVLVLAHQLGHVMKGEGDQIISLLGRALAHARATARYLVFYGKGRDIYDEPGRVAQEVIFNLEKREFHSVGAQQGYSGFSTWMRGLSWAMLGFAEMLEFVEHRDADEFEPFGGKAAALDTMERAAEATSEFYISHTATDGIPYWDTGAPRLHVLGDLYGRPADPGNDIEPVDSSAAVNAAQALLRLGAWRQAKGRDGKRYRQAGLTVMKTLLDEPYLSRDHTHQGLILHSQYHRPKGWDYVQPSRKIPFGESTMWGDYHMRELALYVKRLAENGPYITFFGPKR
jgi:unsaturated chondroitin disaccharide hydrolase